MNEQNDFWGDTPDWTESGERPARQRRADETHPSGRPGTFGSKLKNLWGSAMSSGADATREHGVLDASQVPPEGPGMFDDLDEHDEFAHAEPSTATPLTTGAVDDEAFPVGPTGWSGDDWFGDDVVDVEIEEFSPTHATDQRAERRNGGIDPLLTRIGAAVIVLTLVVPLAINLTSGDEPSELVASADIANTNDEPEVSLAPQATQAPAPATEPAAEVVLDPSQLPPAIPVNTEPASEPSATPAPSSAAADEPAADATATVAAEEVSTHSDDSTPSAPAADSGAIAQPVAADDTADRVAPNCAIDYTVVEGDFWIRLADASGVELAELLEANGATVNTPLFPGTDICLPAGATTPAAPTTAAPATTAPATTAPATTAPATTSTTTTSTTTTTSAPTTSTTTTTTSVPSSPAGPEEIKQIIRDVWPDELEERALEIAYRESRYVPTAKNFCCYGLFQMYWTVHQSWLADIGITSDQQLYDPETNARAAYALYQRAGGWGPWAL